MALAAFLCVGIPFPHGIHLRHDIFDKSLARSAPQSIPKLGSLRFADKFSRSDIYPAAAQ
jgi:hypothetical protein